MAPKGLFSRCILASLVLPLSTAQIKIRVIEAITPAISPATTTTCTSTPTTENALLLPYTLTPELAVQIEVASENLPRTTAVIIPLTSFSTQIDVQNISDSTPTTTTAPSASPTPFPGDNTYILIGCFAEPPANSSRALGANGDYLSPVFTNPDALTVPLCLEACGVAFTSDERGEYGFVGVENSRECYCGRTLSPLALPAQEGYCSLPCAADNTTTCGGYEHLNLYQRRSLLNSTSTSPSTTASTSSSISTPTSSPSQTKSKPRIGMWVGIALGLFFLLVLVLLALWYRKRRQAQPRATAISNAGLSTTNISSFIGGFKLNHPSQKRNRPTTMFTKDGRSFGGIVPDEHGDTGAGRYLRPLEDPIQSLEAGRRKRATFEAWKSGVVPPLK